MSAEFTPDQVKALEDYSEATGAGSVLLAHTLAQLDNRLRALEAKTQTPLTPDEQIGG